MGKHPCIAWVPILWGKKNKAKDCAPPPLVELSEVPECVETVEEGPMPNLPYDIITNILSRLPPKCILQLWETNSTDALYDLTTNPYFLRTLLDRGQSTPTIAIQAHTQSIDNNIKLFFFDDKAGDVKSTNFDFSSYNAYCKGHPMELWGSHDGFLLFRSKPGLLFCIWNPVTKEQVIITSPNILSHICGFYFHPRKREYEVVGVCFGGNQMDFQILNLRTNHRRSVGKSYPPSREKMPVFINGTFYWIVGGTTYFIQHLVYPSLSESILSFNIETEEFRTLEAVMLPEDVTPCIRYAEYQFQLFEMEGDLCLFDPSSKTGVAVIWVFNHNTRGWVKRHSMTEFPIHKEFHVFFEKILYIKMKGEFIVYHSSNRQAPYIYNLRLGTWRLFERMVFQDDKFTAVSHTPSLVSLDAADSVIALSELS